MNTLLRLSSLLLLVVFGCSQPKENNNQVSIVLHVPPGNDGIFEIKIFDILTIRDSLLTSFSVDSAGIGRAEFTIDRPLLASFQCGEVYRKIYLEPGYTLNLQVSDALSAPIVYTGIGAEPNNYLEQETRIQHEIENIDKKNIFSLDVEEFLARVDTVHAATLGYYKRFADSVSLPEHIRTFFEKRNAIFKVGKIQNYAWNYAAERDDFNLPEELDVNPAIPFDTTLLHMGLFDYALMWQLYMQMEYYIPAWKDTSKGQDIQEGSIAPLLVMERINKNNHPTEMKEFLLAKNVDYWLASEGITPAVDSAFQQFKSDYPSSFTLPAIQSEYNKWLKISSGPAPDFSGVTPIGEEVFLHDFKGKVVYIDVWASWCGPCLEEIPYSIALQQEFIPSDSIVFLNVSIDQKPEAWKKMLTKQCNWKGVHILEPTVNDESPITKAYKIWGVPRYIIINKNGDVVNVNAPKPSTGESLVQELKSLL